MRSRMQKKKELSEEQLEIVEAKDFFDRTMPGVIRFYTDHRLPLRGVCSVNWLGEHYQVVPMDCGLLG